MPQAPPPNMVNAVQDTGDRSQETNCFACILPVGRQVLYPAFCLLLFTNNQLPVTNFQSLVRRGTSRT